MRLLGALLLIPAPLQWVGFLMAPGGPLMRAPLSNDVATVVFVFPPLLAAFGVALLTRGRSRYWIAWTGLTLVLACGLTYLLSYYTALRSL